LPRSGRTRGGHHASARQGGARRGVECCKPCPACRGCSGDGVPTGCVNGSPARGPADPRRRRSPGSAGTWRRSARPPSGARRRRPPPRTAASLTSGCAPAALRCRRARRDLVGPCLQRREGPPRQHVAARMQSGKEPHGDATVPKRRVLHTAGVWVHGCLLSCWRCMTVLAASMCLRRRQRPNVTLPHQNLPACASNAHLSAAQAHVVQLEAALKAAEARASKAAAAHAAAERRLAAAGEERAGLRAQLAARAEELVRRPRLCRRRAVPWQAFTKWHSVAPGEAAREAAARLRRSLPTRAARTMPPRHAKGLPGVQGWQGPPLACLGSARRGRTPPARRCAHGWQASERAPAPAGGRVRGGGRRGRGRARGGGAPGGRHPRAGGAGGGAARRRGRPRAPAAGEGFLRGFRTALWITCVLWITSYLIFSHFPLFWGRPTSQLRTGVREQARALFQTMTCAIRAWVCTARPMPRRTPACNQHSCSAGAAHALLTRKPARTEAPAGPKRATRAAALLSARARARRPRRRRPRRARRTCAPRSSAARPRRPRCAATAAWPAAPSSCSRWRNRLMIAHYDTLQVRRVHDREKCGSGACVSEDVQVGTCMSRKSAGQLRTILEMCESHACMAAQRAGPKRPWQGSSFG